MNKFKLFNGEVILSRQQMVTKIKARLPSPFHPVSFDDLFAMHLDNDGIEKLYNDVCGEVSNECQ